MADYTIISDVSTYFLHSLRESMCSEPFFSPNSIDTFSPIDQERDSLLGLYLYDIQEEGEISSAQMLLLGDDRMRHPPRAYTLYYMLFINGSPCINFTAEEHQKLLGRTAQAVNDMAAVLPTSLQPWLEISEPPVVFSTNRLELGDKMRVWQALNKPYQVSLFYRAAPIFISSEVVVQVSRVTDISMGIRLIDDAERQSKRHG